MLLVVFCWNFRMSNFDLTERLKSCCAQRKIWLLYWKMKINEMLLKKIKIG